MCHLNFSAAVAKKTESESWSDQAEDVIFEANQIIDMSLDVTWMLIPGDQKLRYWICAASQHRLATIRLSWDIVLGHCLGTLSWDIVFVDSSPVPTGLLMIIYRNSIYR